MKIKEYIKPFAVNQKFQILTADGTGCVFDGDKMSYKDEYSDKEVDVITADGNGIEIIPKPQ